MSVEININTEVIVNNIRVKCVKDTDIKFGCDSCAFKASLSCKVNNITCKGHRRKDNISVHFEKVD